MLVRVQRNVLEERQTENERETYKQNTKLFLCLHLLCETTTSYTRVVSVLLLRAAVDLAEVVAQVGLRWRCPLGRKDVSLLE